MAAQVLLLTGFALLCVLAILAGLVALVRGHLRPLGIRSRGGALLLIVAAVVGIAVAGDLTTRATHPASSDYPQAARARFTADCERTGTAASCVCLFQSFQRHYPYAEFQALAAADNPQAPQYAVVARDCAGK